jgi:GNAT superfamily N-acetyltransferase
LKMEKIKILPALDEASAGIIEALAREIWPRHYTPIIGEAQVAYMLDEFQSKRAVLEQLAGGTLYYLIQSAQSQSIGYLALVHRPQELFLSKLYLLPSERGKGYSRQAMGFIRAAAREKGLSKITLTVHKQNPSVKVYERLGFGIIGPLMTDIGHGFVMDDYRMELPL